MKGRSCFIALVLAAAAWQPLAADDLTADEISASVLGAMDRTADPCDDFYRYACGGWLDSTPLPSDQARWTRSFSVIREANREFIRDLLESAAADPGDDLNRQKVGHYYGACMNEEAANAAGAAPLKPLLDLIASIGETSGEQVVGRLHRAGVSAFFGGGALPDFQNPDLNTAFMVQGGLGMPDRDYYVSEDPKKQELLAEYERHVARMFGLLGEEPAAAAAHAHDVLETETRMARVSRPRDEMRDPEKLYNPMDLKGLEELTPGLGWPLYLQAIGYPEINDFNIATPEFFKELEAMAADTDIERLKTYLRWHVVDSFADQLSSDFVNANFEFYGQKLSGQQEIQPRWKRCVDATEGALGEVIGKLYVEAKFPGESRDVALAMIGDIFDAFEGGLPGLDWMDDATRARAMEKVAALNKKIGYPDEWRDYSGLKVVADDYFANSLASNEFEFDYDTAKIGKPVNRNEWGMTPQMVNAYYNPLWNEIAFPAGIMQPPFFHKDFPAAMNYGGMGGVIGHELTHGFDDQGRKFAPDGRLREWWEPQVAERFQERAQCVDDFYSRYSVGEGADVNGKLTLGENIGDIGGVKEAYSAFKALQARHGGAGEPAIEGLTDDQLFFVSWGQVWCTVASDEYQRRQVTTDPHSPSRFRVMGPLTLNPAFAKAFSCEPGSKMAPTDRCVIW
jgi:putative endopeptidase